MKFQATNKCQERAGFEIGGSIFFSMILIFHRSSLFIYFPPPLSLALSSFRYSPSSPDMMIVRFPIIEQDPIMRGILKKGASSPWFFYFLFLSFSKQKKRSNSLSLLNTWDVGHRRGHFWLVRLRLITDRRSEEGKKKKPLFLFFILF